MPIAYHCMLTRIRHLLELIRFSHTLFALPFALLAAVMAWRRNAIDLPTEPAWRWQELVGILLCMVAGRSAAMAFNRLADRQIDAVNPRTAGAPSAGRNSQRRQCPTVRRRVQRGVRRQHAPVPAESLAAVPVGAGAACSCSATATPSDSPRWPISGWARLGLGPDRGLDRHPRRNRDGTSGRSAAGRRPRRRGADVGRRLRHHLRLPGLSTSIARQDLHSVPARLGVKPRSTSPPPATC